MNTKRDNENAVDYDSALDLLDGVFALVDDRWQVEAEMFRQFMAEGRRSEGEVRDFIGVLVENLSSEELEQLRPGWKEVLG
jgi:hypothetical protein